MGLIDLIKNFKMRYPYKYIEPCPKCGSKCTGRFVKEPLTEADTEYIELESLKHGEIVRFAPREPVDNAFCVDCGHRWGYTARTIYLTKQEIEDEIVSRGTEMAYTELKEAISQKDAVSGNRKKRR